MEHVRLALLVEDLAAQGARQVVATRFNTIIIIIIIMTIILIMMTMFNYHNLADGVMTILFSVIHLYQLSFNFSLVVIIGDVNDNSPKFSRTSYQASIPENTQKVTVIMEIQIKNFCESFCSLPNIDCNTTKRVFL